MAALRSADLLLSVRQTDVLPLHHSAVESYPTASRIFVLVKIPAAGGQLDPGGISKIRGPANRVRVGNGDMEGGQHGQTIQKTDP